MSDDKIKAVLGRAAEDRAFFEALMEKREAALDACELSPAEKAILMAPTDEQLGKMIEQARRRPWYKMSPLFAAGTAAAAALSFRLLRHRHRHGGRLA